MRLLDLFCGAGGAAMGYYQAGFAVVGVDHKPQPHFPFEFIQADALEYVAEHGQEYDAIHASPPCQRYSLGTPERTRDTHPDLLGKVRDALRAVGKPYVIENVPRSPMKPNMVICACQVGITRLRRVRWFEMNWEVELLMSVCDHREVPICVVGHGTPTWIRKRLGRNISIAEKRSVMQIDWMNRGELSQAIPPAYTEYIGRQLMAHLRE